MKRLSLDINGQNALHAAFLQLDGYDEVAKGVDNGPRIVRVPYKLGAVRRSTVKNLNMLRASLLSYEEAHKALMRETWPDVEDGAVIEKKDDPEKFKAFQAEQKKMLEAKEELELHTLPFATMYPADPNAREFPSTALAPLEQHGLIEEPPATA